ncbi:hypothetical protein HPB49_023626 [Dermacentor silvarum]|uniref:Uncharacterized protein n=2 Tax=Dermacentor silvarum TaxID=543639 RepID=A0ACB8DRD4_DERSI|nr:hypothetical protein HPB49_023626 [Dermacentor silvarum]
MDMRSRAQWSEGETHTLIRVWQDHLVDLRRTKRNAKVYAAIQEELRAEGIDKPLKTIKSKIENLGNKYRDLCKKRCTGQGAISWKYFWELHEFLAALPVNDKSLTDDIGCSSATVEDLVHEMVHGTDSHCEDAVLDQDVTSRPPSPHTSEHGNDAVVPTAEPDVSASPAASGIGRRMPVGKKTQRESLLAQMVEEQRKLRICYEKSKEKENSYRERMFVLHEKAAEREERLIAVLADLGKK